ncbi:nitroreductase/quinone reductase family protein [Pseudonocardia thermophila]|jgi:Domain of unknown function (DUF385).|uniref:nitroreductase/quinone reductase family protein n=1 Tax=Pseudonocardia thermophila TaxID=1848 RepID=UPI00248DB647|nr:nitroreductase/quinone reductase family protein [Pseudonocardia thermophila]
MAPSGPTQLLHRLKRWMYPAGRPNAVARVLNAVAKVQHGTGLLAPAEWVTLEVVGRRSGRVVSAPLVVAEHEGERYLVAMLGESTNWVRNVRAAGGRAVLCHGRRERVRLVEVPVTERAPILRRYLAVAPGARPHVAVDRCAPLAEFARVAADHPVFRVVADAAAERAA